MTTDFSAQQEMASEIWSRSADDELLRERSHWRGFGRYADDRIWLQVGQSTRRELNLLLRLLGRPPLVPDRAHAFLEWGPGGGSNVVALAPFARFYLGVDIADANLAECAGQARAVGLDGFEGHRLVGDPCAEMDPYRERFEYIVSTAVFQHFPSKEYGVEVLKAMSASAAPGALGLVQIRFDNADPRFAPKTSDYDQNYLTATSYRLDEFWQLLADAGFVPIAIRNVRQDINYALFTFRKPES